MRLRFSIRDCLLVTAIVAVALGWWADRRRLLGELEGVRDELQVARDDLAQAPWKAYLWKGVAVGFAKVMREEGWHTKIKADGSGWGYTTPDAFVGDPQRAQELNKANPLPIP